MTIVQMMPCSHCFFLWKFFSFSHRHHLVLYYRSVLVMWVAEKSYVLDLYLTMTMAAVVTATKSNPKTFTNMWL